MVEKILAHIDDNLDEALDRLFTFLKIRSISTDPAYAQDCIQAADWLVSQLQNLGFEATRRETSGHPMVVGHHEGAQKDAPHVLFYGHYDVQPVDLLELWEDDPFEPQLKVQQGRKVIAARGAADDKGQLMTFLEALRAFKSQRGALPLRVSVLFEGEEESGSPSLKPFLMANADELKADFSLVCDTGMWDTKTPAICAGLRGLVGEEVVIHAAVRDLHSGLYGGAAANPLQILTRILGRLHDDEGRVTIPHFYDGVEDVPSAILANWQKLGLQANAFLAPVGLSCPAGESGRSLLELIWSRPTAEINGVSGGYQGEGFKTVIPSQASAKVSFRLVHGQDPSQVRQNFREFVRAHIPVDCRVEFLEHGASPAIQLPFNSKLIETARAALSQEWPNPAVVTAMGGSIPIVGDFQSLLGMESLLVGFGLEDDCIHAPNEKYDLVSFHKGQRSWVRILDALAQNLREN